MAVICRNRYFASSIRKVQGIILLFLICKCKLLVANPLSCDWVQKELQSKGLPIYTSLERPDIGPICGQGSCCGSDIENRLKQYNQINFEQYVRESAYKISSLIETRAKKFDEFFRDMMASSKREFHEMFERTYGKIYLQNSDVFAEFFAELENYYKRGSVRLTETMDTFFGLLYQRMFTVINSQYDFDDKYLDCVHEHMIEMKPFGDIPTKLGVQLRRSFVATRTFFKALQQGAQIAKRMASVKVEESCFDQLTQMQQCGSCTGLGRNVKACAGFCMHTLEGCLRFHTSFNSNWDKFIDGLDKVADRLLGPFNVENVVEPLNIKISEAVMNFQESGVDVSKKIFSMCGQPVLNRKRRKTEDTPLVENPKYEIKYEPIRPTNNKKKHKNNEKVDNSPSMKKLITEIKSKLRETKQFWVHLPYQFCNNETIAASPSWDGNCWNGTAVGFYKQPEVQPSNYQSPVVNEQNFTLQVFLDKLRKAYQGEEVELIDDSEEPLAGSGSGSGQGPDQDLEITDVKVRINQELPEEKIPIETLPPVTSSRKPEIIINVISNDSSAGGAESNLINIHRYWITLVLLRIGISKLL